MFEDNGEFAFSKVFGMYVTYDFGTIFLLKRYHVLSADYLVLKVFSESSV